METNPGIPIPPIPVPSAATPGEPAPTSEQLFAPALAPDVVPAPSADAPGADDYEPAPLDGRARRSWWPTVIVGLAALAVLASVAVPALLGAFAPEKPTAAAVPAAPDEESAEADDMDTAAPAPNEEAADNEDTTAQPAVQAPDEPATAVSARCALSAQRVLTCVGPEEPVMEVLEYLPATEQPLAPRTAAAIVLTLASGQQYRSEVREFYEGTDVDFGTLNFVTAQ